MRSLPRRREKPKSLSCADRGNFMKIARIEAARMFPKVIKEAWVDDEYVWPSEPPSFLIKVTAEDGQYGIGEITSQTWYLGETAAQIEASVLLYDEALRGRDP